MIVANRREKTLNKSTTKTLKKLFVKLTIFISVLGFSTIFLFGELGVKLKETINIPPGPDAPIKVISFCVTNDEMFLIPDFDEGTIKVYEKDGASLKFVNAVGEYGYRQGQLVKPAYCFYDDDSSKFGVMDYGLRKIFIYDRIKRGKFKRVREFNCLRLGYEIQLIKGNQLLISGYREDDCGNPNDFYSIDTKKLDNPNTFLLQSFQKYGLELRNDNDIDSIKNNIAFKGWFDVQGDFAYYVWEGDARVWKINLTTKKVDRFGLPKGYKGNYKKPEIKKDGIFVRNIFTNIDNIFVIYQLPEESLKKGKEPAFRMHIYTLNGSYIKDVPIPGNPNRWMYFDKDSNFLYSLSNKIEGKGENYSINKYLISK
jgi:hypothetical protein